MKRNKVIKAMNKLRVSRGDGFKKKVAFTLAEVLITLAIIGVVAAVTIPTLTRSYQEKIFVNKLKQSYSIFAQAYLMAVNDNGPITDWDIGDGNNSESAEKFYNYFKPYLKKVKECPINGGCFASNYTAMFSDQAYVYQPNPTYTYSTRGILPNGVSFLFWSSGNNNHSGSIKIDVNGPTKPNKAGVDYFGISVSARGVKGEFSKTPAPTYHEFCEYNNSSIYNGVLCTGYVLRYSNMDYLRRDISNDAL